MTASVSSSSVASPDPKQPEMEPVKLSWPHVAFFGMVHLLALLGFFTFSWSAVILVIVMHWCLGSIGICLGYHRLLSHRSFVVPKWLEYIIATLGALTLQGGPIFWAASHRQHHAFTEDVNKDPYSIRRGFWWSHMAWILHPRANTFNREEYYAQAPDLSRDPYYQFLDKYYLYLQIPLGLALYVMGGWSFVVWGLFVRSIVLWHSTWFVNSATHMWGYRRFDSDDHACNLWWVALITYGEGWHNNHHAFPKCAKAGLRWWELDMTFWAIWLLSKVGLAKRLNLNAS